MKENHPAKGACFLLAACLLFALGYLLGSGSAETQVQVTVTEPIQLLQTTQEQTQPSQADLLDLNTATRDELENLPGIGPELADRILRYRQQNGGFVSPEQLMDVQGIGQKRYDALKHLLIVGGSQ